MRATIVTLLAVGALAAGATPAFGWGPTQDLSPAGQAAEQTAIAAASDGTVAVAWRQQTTGSNSVVYAAMRLPGATAFGAAQALSGPGSISGPAIAAAGDGSLTVTWAAAGVAHAATRRTGEARFAAPVAAAQAPGGISGVAIDGAPDGTVVIAYEATQPNGFDSLEVVSRGPGASAFTAPQQADPSRANYFHYAFAVSAGSGGAATLGWWYGTGTAPWQPRAVARTSASGAFGPVQDLGANAPQPPTTIGLGRAADDTVTATWVSPVGGVTVVRAATLAPGTTSFAAAQSVSTGAFPPSTADLAVNPDGTAVVTWIESHGTTEHVIIAERAAGSAAFGAPTDVAANAPGATVARVALAADNAITAVWGRAPGATQVVDAARRPAEAAAFGAIDSLGTAFDLVGLPPELAVAPDGAPTVVWVAPGAIVRVTTAPGTVYPLTVARAGTGTGQVAAPDLGIDCGSACTVTPPLSTRVTLTATATDGSAFGGWSGACTGTATTCTFDLLGARSATATFTAQSPGRVTGLRRGAIGTERSSVRWRAPAAGGGVPITGYQTRIRRVGRPWSRWIWQSAAARSTWRSHAWSRLAPDARYRVQVRAVNRIGAGRAGQVAFRTPPRASLAVTG